jgi:hypothetical protein
MSLINESDEIKRLGILLSEIEDVEEVKEEVKEEVEKLILKVMSSEKLSLKMIILQIKYCVMRTRIMVY